MRPRHWIDPTIFRSPGGEGGGDAAGDGGDDSSILDHADKPAGADAEAEAARLAAEAAAKGEGDDKGDDKGGAAPYDPGKLPDGVLGKTDKETIDALLARHNDLRREISKGKHKDAADIPDAADGYKIEAAGDDDLIALAVNGDDAGDVMEIVRSAALKAKMGQGQFDTFVREFMQEGGNAGMLISDDEATRISGQSEMAELTKLMGSEKAAKEVVSGVDQYFDRLKGLGLVTDEDRSEWRVMFGTARSSLLMHRVLTDLAGFKPVPLEGDRGEGHYTSQEVVALHSKALSMPDGAEKTAELKRVAGLFKRTFGEQPASDSRQAAAMAS